MAGGGGASGGAGGGDGLMVTTWVTTATTGAEVICSPVKLEAAAADVRVVLMVLWVAAAALASGTVIATVMITDALVTSTATAVGSTRASVAKRPAMSARWEGPKSCTLPEAVMATTTCCTRAPATPCLMTRTIERTRGCGLPDRSNARTSKSKALEVPNGRTGKRSATNVTVLS